MTWLGILLLSREHNQNVFSFDLPFGEARLSFDSLRNPQELMQEGGADAIKIEGGADVADDIEKLVATGVPVLGRI